MKRHDGFVPRKSVMGKPINVDPRKPMYDQMETAISNPVIDQDFYRTKRSKPMKTKKINYANILYTTGLVILVIFALLILLNVI